MLQTPNSGSRSYSNPVLRRSFPDPYVLEHCGRYFAYSTGLADDGLAVGMASSDDLVNWAYHGGVLPQIDSRPPLYWAPEVTYSNGWFYMYYSCGNEVFMEIRVALSDLPEGPFEDSGYRLTREEFAIDPHVFVDDDGQRYLFYATDFLEHTHIGTGTVVDRMKSWFELEGRAVPVTRAAYDWQVYDPNRAEKGGVRWHTIEGPTVLKSKDTYIEMFSGGNWKNESYGVAYASSHEIMSPAEWKQSIDGETLMPILTTIPEEVIGPGHNSAAIGPNGREIFCVYHSWVEGERMMSIDRMGVVGSRLFVLGPTTSPQPTPFPPGFEIRDLFLGSGTKVRFDYGLTSAEFLLNLDLRFVEEASELRISLRSDSSDVTLTLSQKGIAVSGEADPRVISFPEDFSVTAFHRLVLRGYALSARLSVDKLVAKTAFPLPGSTKELSLESTGPVEVRRVAVTYGFEDLFDAMNDMNEWTVVGSGMAEIRKGRMNIRSENSPTTVTRGDAYRNFEFIANLRTETGTFALALLDPEGRTLKVFEIDPHPAQDFRDLRQIRILKLGDQLSLETEDIIRKRTKTDIAPACVGIIGTDCGVEIDMVRWTEIPAI